jgi:hypothetical protein
MTVYVTQELKGRDLSSALAFGDLRVVVPAGVDVVPDKVNQVLDAIWNTMRTFNAEEDFLLLSGDPVIIGAVCSAAVDFVEDDVPLRVLRWDRIDRRYIQFDFNL